MQQDIKPILVSKKPPTSETRLYQGIVLTKNDLKGILKEQFDTYGISDQIPTAEAVIACESGWNIHSDNGVSYGIAQFTKPTWKDFGYGDIFNPYWQLKTMAKMWVTPSLRLRWDCYSGKR